MTWIDLLVASAVGAAFLVLPGLLMSLAAGLRGFLSVALAPALSTTALAGGAIVAGILGLRWAWWVPFIIAAILALMLWVLRRLAQARGFELRGGPAAGNTWRADLALWLGLAVAAALIVRQVVTVLQRPDAISQTYDNIFHMAAVRFAVESGNASSLSIAGFNQVEGDPSFYPAAFHGLAALILQYGTQDIAIAVNATALLISALIWPLSGLALVRLALPESAVGVLGAAALLASFSTFPIFLIDFGVLYPNLYGLALVPVVVGLLLQLLRLHAERHVHPMMAGALILVLLPGLVLAHPNALMALLAIGVAPVLAWSLRTWSAEWSSRRRPGALLATAGVGAGVFGLVLLAWQVIRPSATMTIWEPILTAPHAVGEAVMNSSPGGGRAAWLLSAIVAAGIFVALRTGRWWLVASWGTIVALWVVVASFGVSDLRDYLTGIWYNDPRRFSATLPLVAFPLGALGLHSAAVRLTQGAKSLGARLIPAERTRSIHRAAVGVGVGLVMVPALVFGTQSGSYLEDVLARASDSYALSSTSPLLTADEYALLLRTPQEVGEDAVVATNPWNGSSMLYALTGISTTNTHVSYQPTDDQLTLREELDDLAVSAEACRAAQRMGVTHALDFGTQEVHFLSNPYPGLLDLDDAEGFREVDREGDVVLFELTLCR